MQDKSPNGDQFDVMWDRLQTEDIDSFSGCRPRLHYLVGLVHGSGPILNVGVGDGFVESELARLNIECYSVDPSEATIQRLRTRLSMGERARVGRVEELPFADHQFGGIIISEVIEHLHPDIIGRSIAELRRVLRPGGILVGTVPARENLSASMVVCPSCQAAFHRWGHYQAFDCAKVRELFRDTFDIQAIYERPFPARRTINWESRVTGSIKALLAKIGIRRGGENIVFCVRSKATTANHPQSVKIGRTHAA